MNAHLPNRTEPKLARMLQVGWHGSARLNHYRRLKNIFENMAAVNWTRAEVYKLISIWSDDAIQEQLEGCR